MGSSEQTRWWNGPGTQHKTRTPPRWLQVVVARQEELLDEAARQYAKEESRMLSKAGPLRTMSAWGLGRRYLEAPRGELKDALRGALTACVAREVELCALVGLCPGMAYDV